MKDHLSKGHEPVRRSFVRRGIIATAACATAACATAACATAACADAAARVAGRTPSLPTVIAVVAAGRARHTPRPDLPADQR